MMYGCFLLPVVVLLLLRGGEDPSTVSWLDHLEGARVVELGARSIYDDASLYSQHESIFSGDTQRTEAAVWRRACITSFSTFAWD
jgi:hypothetical protein